MSVYLRRRQNLPADVSAGARRLTRDELRTRYGAHPDDIEHVRETLARHGIDLVEADAGARRIVVTGTVSAFAEAFGTSLSLVRTPHPQSPDGVVHRYRTGPLNLPDALTGVVTAVLGIDNRPQARAYFRYAASAAAATAYTPLQVGAAYGFPEQTDGAGETLAIIELGGGYAQSDLDAYFGALGLATPAVTAVPVDGGSNSPAGDPNSADGEVLLDIEVAGALAPAAAQLVYFAPNTDQGFVDAVTAAAHATPAPAAISISWGGPEDSWTAQARDALDQACADAVALGVTVLAASGDSGSSDNAPDGAAHCDFPASSPHVLGCGGTRLLLDGSGAIAREIVWNDGSGGGATGGGVSTSYPMPSWQTGAGVPAHGRGVPDVAGNADPQTGYQIYVDGQSGVVGGTSAVAPLWAALVCRLAQRAGRPLGLLQSTLYANAAPGVAQPGLRDVTEGDNGAYRAGPGWDPCTGLGTPDGAALGAMF
ncbi:S8/S53 family peptidase [Actinocrinis puniceicyclus]|uniref:S8/S53 family peptidase n=1 Tax=Actinocrinis puniceicyclus TaxID=977794 RepID=A0A8J7WN80_9ACTN|nr:S8/S53 family peptidase [Actinocrinis puniceicyclus]